MEETPQKCDACQKPYDALWCVNSRLMCIDCALADAWERGMIVGMDRLALKCCVHTTLVAIEITEAMKYNPHRF